MTKPTFTSPHASYEGGSRRRGDDFRLKEYGDVAEVMEVFGVERVGRYSVRRILTKALTVERAARVHRVPLDEFLEILHKAVNSKQNGK